MILCTQYYRPPFPESRYWRDDLARMRDAGLNALQLWAVWGWIESEPGVFNFDNYDALVAEAEKRGLKVVLSCIAEIHPFWIHRLVPKSNLVDHLGREVPSVGRREVNVGLTPGGCFDHPGVRERMGAFIEALGKQYGTTPHLAGWDAWNETRWTVHAPGHTCYCEHTLARFREWLREKHGDLRALSAAWKRRYASWEDVFPGRYPKLLPTELVEFCDFLAWRAADHMAWRYDLLKAAGPDKLVSGHTDHPSNLRGAVLEQPLSRGCDWDYGDSLDGLGCSHFPFWGAGFDMAGFGARVESVRSAARGKTLWLSELQGGAVNWSTFTHERSVPGGPQQRWVWTGVGRGCKATIFWCWRDEVFGHESSGFGLAGRDGLADDRLAAMARTGAALEKHDALLEAYEPDPGEVGVYFERANHFIDYAAAGNVDRAVAGQRAYALALERLNVPYRYVESRHLDLDGLRLLLVPFAPTIGDESAARLAAFARAGGTVLLEAEPDAFTPLNFYRSEPSERALARELKLADLGRRQLTIKTLTLSAGGKKLALKPDVLHTPLDSKGAKVLARAGRDVLALARPVGEGRVVALGTTLGGPYNKERYAGFERFIEWLARLAGVTSEFAVKATPAKGDFHWRAGRSKNDRLVFLSTGSAASVSVSAAPGAFGRAKEVEDLLAGRTYKISKRGKRAAVSLRMKRDSVAVLRWRAG